MEIAQTGLFSAPSAAAQSEAGLASNFDNFLRLLTTQLQNQDPLSPLDSTQFTEQLVQFASVEQQIQSNQNLEDLLELQRRNQAVGAVGFLGSTVEAFGDEFSLQGGAADFTYTLLPETTSVTISILDENDRLVRTLQGEATGGKHVGTWDGLDELGVAQPDGHYQLRVTAKDSDGNPLDAATGIFGLVTGITSKDGQVVLQLGDINVPLDRVAAVTADKSSGGTTTP